MKLAVSNLGWKVHNDPAVLEVLRSEGVSGIEIAPSKIWPNFVGANYDSALEYRKFLFDEGLEVPAMQAIIYGRPDLQVFNKNSHGNFIEHFYQLTDVANGLGAKVMIFGAPKNRLRGQLSIPDAMDMAGNLFSKLGDICQAQGCCIGIEHNPIEYGCDFLINAADSRYFVDLLSHPGVQLHLDSGGLYLSGGDAAATIKSTAPFCHFHISEPLLAPIFDGVVDHSIMLKALKDIKYDDWLSIEMNNVDNIQPSVTKVVSIYNNHFK
jgi:D-psicose/D-tagatose/L-ribulose 3-epimerase